MESLQIWSHVAEVVAHDRHVALVVEDSRCRTLPTYLGEVGPFQTDLSHKATQLQVDLLSEALIRLVGWVVRSRSATRCQAPRCGYDIGLHVT